MTDDPKAIELMPCCAHLTLRYQTKPVPDSMAVTGAWHCKDCDMEFNITRASHPRDDVDVLPASLQDDVCFIVSKYGVRDIYNATEEILHAVSRGIKIKAGGNDAR